MATEEALFTTKGMPNEKRHGFDVLPGIDPHKDYTYIPKNGGMMVVDTKDEPGTLPGMRTITTGIFTNPVEQNFRRGRSYKAALGQYEPEGPPKGVDLAKKQAEMTNALQHASWLRQNGAKLFTPEG